MNLKNTFAYFTFPKFFIIGILILKLQVSPTAQIIEEGSFKAYIDANQLGPMIMNDSIAYLPNYFGFLRMNLLTRDYKYFSEYINPSIELPFGFLSSAIDKKGNYWTFINNRLVSIDSNGIINDIGPQPPHQITSMKVDANDRVWLGFYSSFITENPPPEHLAFFDGTNWIYREMEPTVEDIVFDNNNAPYIIADLDIYHFNGTSFNLFENFGRKTLAISSDGQVASAGNDYTRTTMSYFRNGTWQFANGNNYALPVYDQENVLWMISSGGDVYNTSNGFEEPIKILNKPTNYRTDNNSFILNLGFDISGQLWLQHRDGLFVATDPYVDEWEFFSFSDIAVPYIDDITSYHDTTWIVSQSKLIRLVDDEFEELNLISGEVRFVHYDKFREGLWVLFYDKAIFVQGNSFEVFDFTNLPSIGNSSLKRILTDEMKNVWIETYKGFIHLDAQNQITTYNFGAELPSVLDQKVFWGMNNSDKSIWVHFSDCFSGACEKELLKIKDNQVSEVQLDFDFPNFISDMTILSDSVIYFGSRLYKNGLDTTYIPDYIPGSHESIILNDSIVLFCTTDGLFFLKTDGTWAKPDYQANQIFNRYAFPAHLNTNGKLSLGYYNLLEISDLEVILQDLDFSIKKDNNSPANTDASYFYPNPSDGLINIDEKVNAICQSCEMNIYNMKGQLLKTINYPFPSLIDISSFSIGTYIFQVKNENEIISVQKVIRF